MSTTIEMDGMTLDKKTDSTQDNIVTVDLDNINDVLSRSTTTPVLLDFWADWCEPCKNMMPILEKLVNEYRGAFILAKVNADEHPMIAQHLGIRGLPTLRMMKNGQFVDEMVGAQTEQSLKQMLDKHVEIPEEQEEDTDDDPLVAQVARARKMGAYAQAITALEEAVGKNPKVYKYAALLAEVHMDKGDLAAAEAVIGTIPSSESTQARPAALLSFHQAVADAPDYQNVMKSLESDGESADLLYTLGVHEVLTEAYEPALERFLSLMVKYPDHNENLGRRTLLLVFDILGANDTLAKKYRRKMFTLLH